MIFQSKNSKHRAEVNQLREESTPGTLEGAKEMEVQEVKEWPLKDVHVSILGTCEHVLWQKGLCHVVKVTEREPWIIQVDPI